MYMVQLMPVHPKTPSCLASFKSRLVLPFWCWLTQVVLKKRPLNGFNSSSNITFLMAKAKSNDHYALHSFCASGTAYNYVVVVVIVL